MGSTTWMAVFDELARDVHRRLEADLSRLPEVACEALVAARLHERITHEQIFRWAVSAPELPEQNITSRFGEPPLEVYRDDDLLIQVLTWMDSTTAIHQHAFAGAFCVLQGASCHTRYGFREASQPCELLRLGELSYLSAEFLEQGACRPIPPGADLIHALFHMERPSVSVVVRTTKDEEHLPQWAYIQPGLAHSPFDIPEAVERRSHVLNAMKVLGIDAAHEALLERLERADLHEAWYLIRAVALRSKQTPQLQALVAQLERIHGESGRRVGQALAAERRGDAIQARRALVHEPEDRWLMAILLNVPSRADALSLIAERHPSSDPVEWLVSRLEALAKQPAPANFGGSTLGLVVDDLGMALCAELLRGEPRDAAIERLVARGAATTDDVGWLKQVDQMLRKSHLLGPLLAWSTPDPITPDSGPPGSPR